MPLHPALVHLPLGLAMLMPVVAIVAGWLLWRARIGRAGWSAVVVLQALLLASGVVALKSGERDEDMAERVVASAPLHQHEAFAEQFVIATGAVLALSLLVFAPWPPAKTTGAAAAMLGTVLVAGLALRVGHAGGQLVYVHGAAAPHVAAAGGSPAATTRLTPPHHDD
ncbi:DUF2231 domain-containing protein [Luteitalea sp.]|uniref:DUF2231 domain-containing protein n=1 Tax=Luteitalea sp. TaxID=2004800 RepID=UPI0025BE4C0A|nr:DUF2231 domain-containing protein [Luteitalea sp.]